jgi:hypothetical protein
MSSSRRKETTPSRQSAEGLGAWFDGAAVDPVAAVQVMTQEALRFWAQRTRAHASLMEAASACQTPVEFMELLSAFVLQAQQHYAQEGVAMAHLVAANGGTKGKSK